MLRISRFGFLVLSFGSLKNVLADLSTTLTGMLSLELKIPRKKSNELTSHGGPPSLPKSDQGSNLISHFTNAGESPMTLLKDPRGLLSPFPTNKFSFTDDKGQAVFPRFIGTRVKYAPDATTSDNYASLSPGESLQVTHDRR